MEIEDDDGKKDAGTRRRKSTPSLPPGLWKMLLVSAHVYFSVVALVYSLWSKNNSSVVASVAVTTPSPSQGSVPNVVPVVSNVAPVVSAPAPAQPRVPVDLNGKLLRAAWAWAQATPVTKEMRDVADIAGSVPVVLRMHGLDLGWRELFEFKMAGGQRIQARDCYLISRKSQPDVKGLHQSTIVAGEVVTLRCPGDLEALWSASLLQLPSGTESLRIRFEFSGISAAGGKTAANVERLLFWPTGGAACPHSNSPKVWPEGTGCFRTEGVVDGSPLVNPVMGAWITFEHPRGVHSIIDTAVEVSLSNPQPKVAYFASIGVSPVNATRDGSGDAFPLFRRHFHEYLRLIRASAPRPNLHYSSWYDLRRKPCTDSSSLGYNACSSAHPLNEERVSERFHTIHRELAVRGVSLDGFVLDDGWDDAENPWQVEPSNFPRRLDPLREAMSPHSVQLGAWMSPWGGFGEAGKRRLKVGVAHGFELQEVGQQSFKLSGSHYYEHFRSVARDLALKSGVRYFKFDGFGVGLNAKGAGTFHQDIDKLIHLTSELHDDIAMPKLHSNQTQKRPLWVDIATGSWPSPFWLLSVDTVWRDGPDLGKEGEGSPREQWITFRDSSVYANVVLRAPLFPLSSVDSGGIVWSRAEEAGTYLNSFTFEDFKIETRSFFLSGASSQQLKIQPEILTPAHWDVIADAANISKRYSDVLQDAHWIGGDPSKGQPYGYASFACPPCIGLITWRNPRSVSQNITFSLRRALSLPKAWLGGSPEGRWKINELWSKVGVSTAHWSTGLDSSIDLELGNLEFRAFEASLLRV